MPEGWLMLRLWKPTMKTFDISYHEFCRVSSWTNHHPPPPLSTFPSLPCGYIGRRKTKRKEETKEAVKKKRKEWVKEWDCFSPHGCVWRGGEVVNEIFWGTILVTLCTLRDLSSNTKIWGMDIEIRMILGTDIFKTQSFNGAYFNAYPSAKQTLND